MNDRKRTFKDWLIVILSLLDDAIVLVAVILALRYFKVAVTFPVIVIIAVLFIGFVMLMHKAIVPSLHLNKITGAEGMVGLDGKVVDPLTPYGRVRVGSELWKAHSVEAEISRGEDVEVVGVNNLTLEVRRKKQVQ
ncbi:MAG: NfeD family protein [Dehalococcoidales bacterium]|nr:NfeD family protein [Dehalococcoidales bacterium]